MFFAKVTDKRGQIYIYEEIGQGWFGGITAKSFSETLKELGNVNALDIYINSPGGSVFDGIAIYNQIKRFTGEKVIHIDGIAASIASVIAMAGDKIKIASNGMFMIHDPWTMAAGTADDMRKMADSLDKVRETILTTYAAKTGRSLKEIGDWMTAETWMDAKESVEYGFATEIGDEKPMKAEFAMLAKFKNAPEQLRQQATASRVLLARMDKRAMQLNSKTK